MPSDQSSVEKALKIVQNLFLKAAEGSDDDIAEFMNEIHPRAFKKAAEFLNYVAQHNAWCALDFNKRIIASRLPLRTAYCKEPSEVLAPLSNNN